MWTTLSHCLSIFPVFLTGTISADVDFCACKGLALVLVAHKFFPTKPHLPQSAICRNVMRRLYQVRYVKNQTSNLAFHGRSLLRSSICPCVDVSRARIAFVLQMRHVYSSVQISHIPYLEMLGLKDGVDNFEEIYLHFADIMEALHMRVNLPLDLPEQELLLEHLDLPAIAAAAADLDAKSAAKAAIEAAAYLRDATGAKAEAVKIAAGQDASTAAGAACQHLLQLASQVEADAIRFAQSIRGSSIAAKGAAMRARVAAAGDQPDQTQDRDSDVHADGTVSDAAESNPAKPSAAEAAEAAADDASGAAATAVENLHTLANILKQVQHIVPGRHGLGANISMFDAQVPIWRAKFARASTLSTGITETGCVICSEKYVPVGEDVVVR